MWALRTDKNLICVGCDDIISSYGEVSSEQEQYLKAILHEKGSFYIENVKATKILSYYSQMKDIPLLFNGVKRKKHYTVKIWIKYVIKQIILKCRL